MSRLADQYGNLVTSASLAAGVVALMLASDGRLGWAMVAVGVAALLDSVDGWVARRTGSCGPFGCHLDSLADLVAFGAAPALMLHQGGPEPMSLSVTGAGIAFVVAGAWRLARFQLLEDRAHFIGLPIPPAGLIVALAALITIPTALAVALCLVLSLLMVAELTVPTLAELGRLVRGTGSVIVVGPAHGPGRVFAGRRARGGRRDPGADVNPAPTDKRAPA